MRRLLFAAVVMLFACLTVTAQDYPKAEVFGGYSYFRADDGGNLHGWNASVAGNVNKWFGIKADFSGHYGQDFVDVSSPAGVVSVEADQNIHNFLFGPQFTYREHRTLEGFAHALFGGSRAHADVSVNIPGVSTQVDSSDTAFAAAVGGGLDAKFHKSHLAWRVFQADYVLTRFGDSTQHNFRLSTGIVLRFGAK